MSRFARQGIRNTLWSTWLRRRCPARCGAGWILRPRRPVRASVEARLLELEASQARSEAAVT